MSLGDSRLESALEILGALAKENIHTPENMDAYPSTMVKKIRSFATLAANQQKVPAPGLTSCLATLLFKFGACQELSQWFALESIIKMRSQAVNLIFLGNRENLSGDNHALVLIGEVRGSENLLVGKGSRGVTLPSKEYFAPVAGYFDLQAPESVWADPLLGLAWKATEKLEGFKAFEAYCRKHRITHVTGVKEYCDAAGLLENAERVKQNALVVFKEASEELFKVLPASQVSALKLLSRSPLFSTTVERAEIEIEIEIDKIAAIVKKYKLANRSCLELEKALRNAAANNQVEDLEFLCSQSINLNAKGPTSGKTALHVAAERGHLACVRFLVRHGTDLSVQDNDTKTPEEYAASPEMRELLNPVEASPAP
jgi:hypothetical protein